MPVKVPSLSASGWLTEISEKADRLMAYYLTSEHSQSHVYFNNVTSLTFHVQRYGNNPIKLQSRVEADVRRYLSRYFDSVEIEVRTDVVNPDDPERINLQINANVYENGYRYNLGREISVVKGQVEKIFNMNNG